MKLFILLLIATSTCVSAQTHRILFLGNSYTAVNNLPLTFHDLALSGGDTVIYDSNTPGGYTLQGHSTNSTSLSKIALGNWDYIVLQEQSQLPSFPPSQVQTDVFPYARALDSIIALSNACTETVFYMTWGRKYGDASNCASYPPICTFTGMQDRLRTSYVRMAQDNHATVAPAGQAWKRSRELDSTINLWSADDSHPSLEGTYLTACVFYATLFQKTPVGLSYHSSLSAPVAGFLQQVADEIVFDSLSTWQVAIDHPQLSFSNTQQGGLLFDFISTSQNADSVDWIIDGNSYSGNSVSHTFSADGTYTITLIGYNSCFTDTLLQNVTIVSNSIVESSNEMVQVFPNPTRDRITVTNAQGTYSIYSVSGSCVANGNLTSPLSIENLENGIYFLEVATENETRFFKLIKE